MKRKAKLPFDPKVFLSKVNGGRAISDYRKDQIVYTQGEPADSVFYIQSGKVKKTVVSDHCCTREENSCQPGAVRTWAGVAGPLPSASGAGLTPDATIKQWAPLRLTHRGSRTCWSRGGTFCRCRCSADACLSARGAVAPRRCVGAAPAMPDDNNCFQHLNSRPAIVVSVRHPM